MSIIDSIISAESGGNATAKNPRSSATGAGQFIQSTWIDMLSRNRPDLVEGKSPDEILALRNDPALSRQMTEAYAAENGAKLSQAGLPVTPGTQYLAHFAGPQGAVSVLQADPSAPVSSVLTPAAVKANPFLQGMTVGQLQAWADKKMGGAQSVPVSPAATANGPVAPSQPAPIFGQQPAQAAPVQSAAPASVSVAPEQGAIFAAPPSEPMAQLSPMAPPQRRPIDLSKLRAALSAARPIFGRA